jgi:hypothetical protein
MHSMAAAVTPSAAGVADVSRGMLLLLVEYSRLIATKISRAAFLWLYECHQGFSLYLFAVR